MRSQLFGFTVSTQIIYEADLPCPLIQAREISAQYIQRLEGIGSPANAICAVDVQQIYSFSMETWLSQWEEEPAKIIHDIAHQFHDIDEMLRFQLLKEALPWHWLRLKETALIAQIHLTSTMEDTVHVALQLGWNQATPQKDIDGAIQFAQGYFTYFERIKIPCHWRQIFPVNGQKQASRPYGMRLDTAEKLQKLRTYREKERIKGKIRSTRMAACELIGITLSTFKKYDKVLYDRWYEANYQPAT